MSELAAELQDWIEDGLRLRDQWDARLALEVRELPTEPAGTRVPPGYVGESDYQERADAAFACAFRLRRRGDDDDPLLRSLPQRIRALFDNERGHVLDGRYTSGMVAELNDIELTMLYGSDKPDCALKVWLIDRL